jgi:hypothetical protein
VIDKGGRRRKAVMESWKRVMRRQRRRLYPVWFAGVKIFGNFDGKRDDGRV